MYLAYVFKTKTNITIKIMNEDKQFRVFIAISAIIWAVIVGFIIVV
jgi:hypothetical protein